MKRNFLQHCTALLLCFATLFLSACAPIDALKQRASAVDATVVEIEKYGHAVLDITVADLTASGYALGDVVCVRTAAHSLEMPYYNGYYCPPDELMLRGATPQSPVAVCINYNSFCEQYGVQVGDTLEIRMVQKEGMLPMQEICSLQYNCDRASYADDATFANFRMVTAGRIGNNKLFRSASPINDEFQRAACASGFITDAGVATVLNLADSREEILEHFASFSFDPVYYRGLYDAGQVCALDLGANFRAPDFSAAVTEGLIFLSNNEPPFHIHCKEGKDRTGFVCMLLSALMGAGLQEIVDDYMLSFYNYYGVDKEKEPDRYQAILDYNLYPMLCHVAAVEDSSMLAQVDLEEAVTQYLLEAGMPREALSRLKEKLN